MLNIPNAAVRLAIWNLRSSEFMFKFVYSAGMRNKARDPPLRLDIERMYQMLLEDNISRFMVSIVQFMDLHISKQDSSSAYIYLEY